MSSGDHLNYSIIEINQNTKECSEDLKKFSVIQDPVEKPQLTLA